MAPNRLERCFEASGPNQKWCCDIAYVPTAEGFLYVAAVIDLFSRRIVGWAMEDHLRAELCIDALSMAVRSRGHVQGLLHHGDRGVQYACPDYQQVLEEHQRVASMSRRADCYDNALTESFWGTLKTELTYHERYPTRAEARQSIFEFIEVFYNRQRRHSAKGCLSPDQFEAQPQLTKNARPPFVGMVSCISSPSLCVSAFILLCSLSDEPQSVCRIKIAHQTCFALRFRTRNRA